MNARLLWEKLLSNFICSSELNRLHDLFNCEISLHLFELFKNVPGFDNCKIGRTKWPILEILLDICHVLLVFSAENGQNTQMVIPAPTYLKYTLHIHYPHFSQKALQFPNI